MEFINSEVFDKEMGDLYTYLLSRDLTDGEIQTLLERMDDFIKLKILYLL